VSDSASTEHTPPTAEQIAAEIKSEDRRMKVGDDQAFSQGVDELLRRLKSAGLLPESPSAAPTDAEIAREVQRRIRPQIEAIEASRRAAQETAGGYVVGGARPNADQVAAEVAEERRRTCTVCGRYDDNAACEDCMFVTLALETLVQRLAENDLLADETDPWPASPSAAPTTDALVERLDDALRTFLEDLPIMGQFNPATAKREHYVSVDALLPLRDALVAAVAPKGAHDA
jgi:hypothetical protein